MTRRVISRKAFEKGVVSGRYRLMGYAWEPVCALCHKSFGHIVTAGPTPTTNEQNAAGLAALWEPETPEQDRNNSGASETWPVNTRFVCKTHAS